MSKICMTVALTFLVNSVAHATPLLEVTSGFISARDDLQWDYSYRLTGDTFDLHGISSSAFPAPAAFAGGLVTVPIRQLYSFVVDDVLILDMFTDNQFVYGLLDLQHEGFTFPAFNELPFGTWVTQSRDFTMTGHMDLGYDFVGQGFVEASMCRACFDGSMRVRYTFTPTVAVPEPATIYLMAGLLAGLAGRDLRRRSRRMGHRTV